MGLFSKMSAVKTYGSSRYFKDGIYIAEITKVRFNEGHKGESFVVETNVKGTKSEDPEAPQPGESAANVWNATGPKRDIALSNWKEFLIGAFDIDTDSQNQMGDQEWEELSNSVLNDCELEGVVMYLECWTKDTNTGGKFTMHKWHRRATEADLKEFGL
jgi:hypothetical protein